jgi:GNAT superfamily N-acetyltransferase
MQGKGLGSALMQPILELCEREGIPAYLETETESNVGFYSRKGFTVRQEIYTSDGKSKVWTMLRGK